MILCVVEVVGLWECQLLDHTPQLSLSVHRWSGPRADRGRYSSSILTVSKPVYMYVYTLPYFTHNTATTLPSQLFPYLCSAITFHNSLSWSFHSLPSLYIPCLCHTLGHIFQWFNKPLVLVRTIWRRAAIPLLYGQ